MPAAASISPFASNPIETREDLSRFLTGLLDALGPHTSPGGALIHLGHTATHFDETAAQLEGFSRPIWGLASLLASGAYYPGTERWVRGFDSGTDPENDEFWGEMRDKDQRMVECAAIGYAIAVAKEALWDPLPGEAKERFEKWLGGMNDKQMPNTNWLWFRVFANLGLSKAGSSRYDAARMKADLDHLDTFYVADGWSRDGPETVCQFDYYSSSFAIQYAQLVYSKIMREEDPERSEAYRERARKFALNFVHYFDNEGRAIPFGRSMCYRFAQASFWGALAFADVSLPAPFTWGVVRGLLLRNIRYWAHQPGAFNPDGTLTLGFNYPNHNMLENYNSSGSVYWCCKSFIPLAIPASHPFWAEAEEPHPFLNGSIPLVKVLKQPLHIASHRAGHTFVLSSGQQCSYSLKQSAAKYGKFAYSSAFGYSVPVGNGTLYEAAADSALAICDLSTDAEGEFWRTRRVVKNARFEGDVDGKGGGLVWLRSEWEPWPDVSVETWLVPPEEGTPAWHVRVHRIRTSRALKIAEGGFAIYSQRTDGRHLDRVPEGKEDDDSLFGVLENDSEARAASRAGVSAIVALPTPSKLKMSGEAIRVDANSNLVEARTILPTLLAEIEPGSEVWLAIAVFGVPSAEGQDAARKGWSGEWRKRPQVPDAILNLIH